MTDLGDDTSNASKLISALVALALLAAAGGAAWFIATSGPKQEKVQQRPSLARVEVAPLELSDREVAIEAHGTVEADRLVELGPEAEGRVVEIHENLQPGGILRKGQVLLKVEPADFRLAVVRAEADLENAEAELAIEEGRSGVARREWTSFGTTMAPSDGTASSPKLALREPQMKQAKARVNIARARLAEARLKLGRTSLVVPFDAFVQEERVEIGQRVGPSSPVATLVGIETFRLMATLPLSQANQLSKLAPGSPVTIELSAGLGNSASREGRFVRRLPDLDAAGRVARIMVAIDDPLGDKGGQLPIPLGSFVKARLAGAVVEQCYSVAREALRANDQVWVRDGAGKLRFRPVEVVWRQTDNVFVRGQFEEGDQLITSYLPDPLPGMDVQVRETK